MSDFIAKMAQVVNFGTSAKSGALLLACVALVLVMGLPVIMLLFHKSKKVISPVRFWALVPFAGYCVIAAVERTLIMLHVRVADTAWPLLALGVAATVLLLWQKVRIPRPPRWMAVGLCVVILLQSAGYILLGADAYKGYNSTDDYYTVTNAQFVKDYALEPDYWDVPYATHVDNVPNKPYIAGGMAYKQGIHRLSRAAVTAFWSTITGASSGQLLGTVMLFCPILLFAAFCFIIGDGLVKKRWVPYVCIFCAVVGGTMQLHLRGFTGASLCVPFMILWCALLPEIKGGDRWRYAIFSALFVTTATTVYTDMTVIFVGLYVGILGWELIFRRMRRVDVLAYLATVLFAVLINIQFGKLYYNEVIVGNRFGSTWLDVLYPYAFTIEGVARSVFGVYAQPDMPLAGAANAALSALAVLVYIMGIGGLVYRLVKDRGGMLIAMLVLQLSPLFFLLRSEPMAYQYYRMVLCCMPIMSLGFFMALEAICDKTRLHTTARRLRRVVMAGGFAVFALSALLSSWTTVKAATKRGDHEYFPSVAEQRLRKWLSTTSGKSIFLIARGDMMDTQWLFYYGRNDSMWLAHHSMDDMYVDNFSAYPRDDYSYLQYDQMPEDTEIVYQNTFYKAARPAAALEDFGMLFIDAEKDEIMLPWGEEKVAGTYGIICYAKKEADCKLTIWVAPPEGGSGEYTVTSPSGEVFTFTGETELSIPMHIDKGYAQYNFSIAPAGQGGDNAVLEKWNVDFEGYE